MTSPRRPSGRQRIVTSIEGSRGKITSEHRRDLEMQTILVLTWFILFDDFSIGQKILNELAGYSKCQPCACTCTRLQHNADDFSIFKIIYGASAGTWPPPLYRSLSVVVLGLL